MRRLMGFRKSEDEANVTKMINVPTSEKLEAIRSMVSSAGIGSSLAMIDFATSKYVGSTPDSKRQEAGASE